MILSAKKYKWMDLTGINPFLANSIIKKYASVNLPHPEKIGVFLGGGSEC
jgi:hypothetical protein